jgi:hypothetical protein
VGGAKLEAVWAERRGGITSKIALVVGGQVLLASADPDYDTLNLRHGSSSLLHGLASVGVEEPWSSFISKPLSWGWLTVIKQGYVDGVLLGFGDDIDPKLILNVSASDIRIGTIEFISPEFIGPRR